MSLFENVFGGALVGVIASAVVFGILSLQVFSYFRLYTDPIWMKILVLTIWTIECFQIFSTTHMIYTYLIIDTMSAPEKLGESSWEWSLYLGLSTIVAFIVQSFLTRRVLILGRERGFIVWILLAIIASLALVSFGFGLAVMGHAYALVQFQRFAGFTWGVNVWLACAASADIIIAGSLCWLLHTARTGVQRTDKVIDKLIAYTVQTGALTSAAAIISFSTFTTLGFNFYHVFLSFPLGGLYATSLLASLHARKPTAVTSKGSTFGSGMGSHVFELGGVSTTAAGDASQGGSRIAYGKHTESSTVHDDGKPYVV